VNEGLNVVNLNVITLGLGAIITEDVESVHDSRGNKEEPLESTESRSGCTSTVCLSEEKDQDDGQSDETGEPKEREHRIDGEQGKLVGKLWSEFRAEHEIGKAEQGEDGVEDHEVDLAERDVVIVAEEIVAIADARQVGSETQNDQSEESLYTADGEDNMFKSHYCGRIW